MLTSLHLFHNAREYEEGPKVPRKFPTKVGEQLSRRIGEQVAEEEAILLLPRGLYEIRRQVNFNVCNHITYEAHLEADRIEGWL